MTAYANTPECHTMTRSYVLLFLLGAIWGASFLLIKVGTTEIAPLTFALLRVSIGAATTAVVLAIGRKRLPRDGRVWGHLAVMGLFGIGVPYAAISWGTQYIPSSLSAILNGMMPIFTFLVVVIMGSERFTLRRLIGVILGFAGTSVLVLPQLTSGGIQASVLGSLAVILAALSYAVAVVYAKRHVSHLPYEIATFGQLALAALMLLPLAIVEPSWRAAVTMRSVGSLLFLGTVSTALAYLIYYRLIREAGATFTSLVTYISPPFGVFWGRLILDEAITVNVIAALGLILVGLLLVRTAPRFSAGTSRGLPREIPANT
jgi:drug/metabolite transporter (DMT)-like permease